MYMEALVQGFSSSVFDQIPMDGFKYYYNNHHNTYMDLPFLSRPPNSILDDVSNNSSSPSFGSSNASEEGDPSDATLKLINQMLMEEDNLEHKPCMYQQYLALQATEKSFYDVLGEEYPSLPYKHHLVDQSNSESTDDKSSCWTWSSESSNSPAASVNNSIDSNWILRDEENLESSTNFHDVYSTFESILESITPSNGYSDAGDGSVLDSLVSPLQTQESSNREGDTHTTKVAVEEAENKGRVDELSPNGSREKKTHYRDQDGDYADGGRSNKQLASHAEESDEPMEMFDKVLLCPVLNPHLHGDSGSRIGSFDDSDDSQNGGAEKKLQQNGTPKGSSNGGGKARSKKNGNRKEVVDLRSLLSQCAQSVATADVRAANELLKRIRQHSSAHGDGTERAAYYFANALEARLAGTGTTLYAAFTTRRISVADILKGYQTYMQASPFNMISNMLANRTIGKLAQKATRLHIIDFGILYGFQWPCLIQKLSVRPEGPPNIRITGIDFPQPGFRPAERVEETGHRLATYCKRFNVPFEYSAIAKKWETIKLEDLKIDRDEVLVVNCMHRLRNVLDETVVVNSPRDAVLNLVRKINPDMFIHGVVNGTYNTPFFVPRFRQALFHFSSMFDMFEATVPREDEGRLLFESECIGKEVMNIIACEDTERIERPETYKQWQIRSLRAGFRQLPLNQEILKDAKAMIKSYYHKDYVFDEDGNWMLQGWKGRIIYALSCWKPIKE